jgi:enoyl-CoA hydratase
VLALYGLPKPTVAAVNGHTFAAGFVLALACDVRYAAKAAYKLGITEVGAGIPFPACALMVVQAELEPSTARSLSLSGRTFASDDPVTAHFIDTFVAPERLLEAAVAEASAAAGRRAYAAVKAQLRAPLLERMRRCVDDDSDPLARNWF